MRKAQRELSMIDFDINRSRQAIVDLTGTDAATKLDHQLDIEMAKLGNSTEIDSQASLTP